MTNDTRRMARQARAIVDFEEGTMNETDLYCVKHGDYFARTDDEAGRLCFRGTPNDPCVFGLDEDTTRDDDVLVTYRHTVGDDGYAAWHTYDGGEDR